MKDELSIRMKENYENRTRLYLPRRTYTLLRVDGKCFSNYTKGLFKPFDIGFVSDMDATAMYLCKNIQGAEFAFVQSDEISILLTDFKTPSTDAWFDGNVQKMCSISASMATAKFNQLRMLRFVNDKLVNGTDKITELYVEKLTKIKLAEFDSRVWTIPSRTEVINYFIWRQQDTVRNSISSVAQSLYSHRELEFKNQDQMQEMCFQKGVNWNDIDPKLKRGRFIHKVKRELLQENPKTGSIESYQRSVWISDECPIFTQDKEFLLTKIPVLE